MAATGSAMPAADLLASFEEHLRRVRGVSAGTCRNYLWHAGLFLEAACPDGLADASELTAVQVSGFVVGLTSRYAQRTVELAATALRCFFRFLRAAGLRADRLEDAVPMVPNGGRRLVRHLSPGKVGQLIASLGSPSPRDLRDKAMIVCIARLGLRAGEVAALCLEDVDWRNAALRVRSRKTGHGAVLPLTAEVGEAIAAWLREGRPAIEGRPLFVQLQRGRAPGCPLTGDAVGSAVARALARAGIDAPVHGANLLRHSLATGLQAGGASMQQIAGLMGHSSLATTRIYAAVDVAALRQIALPWPGAAR
jgi:integrase/recombinase XerD